jgi:HK97 family phage major capsid protein
MPTLAELRAAREKAGANVQRLAAESQADGFTATAEWEAGWTKANDEYNAALAAEEAKVAQLNRVSAGARVAADAARMNDAGRGTLRPDYTPSAADTNPNRLPARPRNHGPLRAFKGEGAVDRAERAGMWAAATLYRDERAARWCAEHGVPVERGSFAGEPSAVLNTGDNTAGGYFVPNEVDYTVQELALVYGLFRQYAEIVNMGSGTKESPRWTGAMTAYWTAEGGKPSASDPAWDLVTLVAKEVKAMTKMTRVLDEDSAIFLGDKLTLALAEAFSLAEDNAGFNGDGTSSYGGIEGLIPKVLAAAAAYATAAAGNVSAATLDLDDFNAVVAKLPNYPGIQPVWFMHKTFYIDSAQRLQMALGGIVPADVQMGARPMLLGYPVVYANVMKSAPAANEIGALLGDLRWSSKLGNRRGRTVEMGFENDDFTKGLMTVLGTQRVAINNHTITDPRSASNPGPVIGLKLAAS